MSRTRTAARPLLPLNADTGVAPMRPTPSSSTTARLVGACVSVLVGSITPGVLLLEMSIWLIGAA